MVLRVMRREGELLRPLRRVIGVIESQPKGGWRLRGTGNAGIHEGPGEPSEVFAVSLGFRSGAGGGTGSVLLGVQGSPLDTAWKEGGTAKGMGVMRVGIPRGDLINTLGQQVP